MNCPKKAVCPKQPANSLPIPKDAKLCRKCEKGKDKNLATWGLSADNYYCYFGLPHIYPTFY